MNCEICTLLLDDILLEDIAKAKIMKKHLDVLHRKMPLETKNCQPCQELLLMIDGQIAEVRLDEIGTYQNVTREGYHFLTLFIGAHQNRIVYIFASRNWNLALIL